MVDGTYDDATYSVVVNDEDQYSIWPAGRDLPRGWRVEGSPRSREDCLLHIREVWTDPRPKGLREQMRRESADG